MAYQNVGTPRFYIDLGQYLLAIGHGDYNGLHEKPRHLLSLNPAKVVDTAVGLGQTVMVKRISPIKYVAYLGHNGMMCYPEWRTAFQGESGANPEPFDGVNIQLYSESDYPEHSGFSIFTFADNESQEYMYGYTGEREDESQATIGAISIGDYYDMPHSPDLNLKLSYEYDGVKTTQAKNGATLSNAMYTKPADWGNAGAWQLGGEPNYRTGRRIWDLQFSYLADSDIFPNNASTSYASGSEQDDFEDNVLSDDDFFSVVWNKTLGNALPFIFQPDNTNDNPDQFAICKFKKNSLKISQKMHKKYEIKLKIEEVW